MSGMSVTSTSFQLRLAGADLERASCNLDPQPNDFSNTMKKELNASVYTRLTNQAFFPLSSTNQPSGDSPGSKLGQSGDCMDVHNIATGSLYSCEIFETRIIKIHIRQRLGAEKEAFHSPVIILSCTTPIPTQVKYVKRT